MMRIYWHIVADAMESVRLRNSFFRVLLFLASLVASFRLGILLHRFNNKVYNLGLSDAAQWLLGKLYDGDVSNSPSQCQSNTRMGSLFIANHPGLGDSLNFLRGCQCSRLRILVKDRKIFRAMDALVPNLLIIPEDPARRRDVIRGTIQHLRGGGDCLLYPAGEIEPDPAMADSIFRPRRNWSKVPLLLSRMANKEGWSFRIVGAGTSGVYDSRWFSNRFVRSAASAEQRDARAAYLMLMVPWRKSPAPMLRLTEGIPSDSFDAESYDLLRSAIEQQRRDLGETLIPIGH